MEIRFCINENPPSESMLHVAITNLEKTVKRIKNQRLLTTVGIAIVALLLIPWIYSSVEIGWTGVTGTAVFAVVATWAGGAALAAWASLGVITAFAVLAGILGWSATAVITAMIALAIMATMAGWQFFENKLSHFNGLIETLTPTSQSDYQMLIDLAEKQPAIKSYMKALSVLESARIPVKGEYDLLVDFKEKYDQTIANKENKSDIARECKLIISW